MTQPGQLVRYEAARQALAEAHRIDEVKDIRDKAQAMAAYAKQAKDSALIEWATEIKVRAERRCGEMLRETAERGERTTAANGRKPKASSDPTLSDLGITRDQSSRFQKLAAMPEEHFESAIAMAKEAAGEVTTAFMLRMREQEEKPPAAADSSVPVVIPEEKPKSELLQVSEIFGAIEVLAKTTIDPETYQDRLPFYRHYRITRDIEAAKRFLDCLAKHWRVNEAA